MSVTANSSTSYGGHLRELRFQLWKNLQVWVVTMASVQMVSCCCPGQRVNHWHGMSQYQTPMPTPSRWHGDHSRGGSWQGGRQQGGQIQAAGQQPHLCTSCRRVSRDLESPSSGISIQVGPTKTLGRQLTCSSGCQWLYSGAMRSPSTALSPPTKHHRGLFGQITTFLPTY